MLGVVNSWVFPATAVRVVDGDTFIARVDLGFRVFTDITIRVKDLSCPERFTPEGQRATEAAVSYLMGKPLEIQSWKDKHSFDRWICDVWIGGQFFLDLMRESGNGEYSKFTFDREAWRDVTGSVVTAATR